MILFKNGVHKHAEIIHELHILNELIDFEVRRFDPLGDVYAGSDLETLEQYNAYLTRSLARNQDAHRPAEISVKILKISNLSKSE